MFVWFQIGLVPAYCHALWVILKFSVFRLVVGGGRRCGPAFWTWPVVWSQVFAVFTRSTSGVGMELCVTWLLLDWLTSVPSLLKSLVLWQYPLSRRLCAQKSEFIYPCLSDRTHRGAKSTQRLVTICYLKAWPSHRLLNKWLSKACVRR